MRSGNFGASRADNMRCHRGRRVDRRRGLAVRQSKFGKRFIEVGATIASAAVALVISIPAVEEPLDKLSGRDVLENVRQMYTKGTLASGARYIAEPERVTALSGT